MGLAYFESCFVYLYSFGSIEYLYIDLHDAFFDGVLAFGYGQIGDTLTELLLLDGIQTFATVVERPVGIDAIASVIGCLALAGGDVVAADDGTVGGIGAVYDALADAGVERGEEVGFGRLYVFLCALCTDTVATDGNVVLQGIVYARL